MWQTETNKKLKNLTRYQVATIIAVIFHTVGFIGILVFKSEAIINTTALNMLLMTLLLFYTHEQTTAGLLIFFIVCFIVGYSVELIGISTGYLFGNYQYLDVLGPKVRGVPLIIGVNWFIIIYCCGSAMQILLKKITARLAPVPETGGKLTKILSVIIDGATLAVIFDWLMEPVAVKLGYWQWLGDGDIPLYNYICWFVISILLLFVFQRMQFPKENKFAVNLLLIQTMFFLLLRTFL